MSQGGEDGMVGGATGFPKLELTHMDTHEEGHSQNPAWTTSTVQTLTSDQGPPLDSGLDQELWQPYNTHTL